MSYEFSVFFHRLVKKGVPWVCNNRKEYFFVNTSSFQFKGKHLVAPQLIHPATERTAFAFVITAKELLAVRRVHYLPIIISTMLVVVADIGICENNIQSASSTETFLVF